MFTHSLDLLLASALPTMGLLWLLLELRALPAQTVDPARDLGKLPASPPRLPKFIEAPEPRQKEMLSVIGGCRK